MAFSGPTARTWSAPQCRHFMRPAPVSPANTSRGCAHLMRIFLPHSGQFAEGGNSSSGLLMAFLSGFGKDGVPCLCVKYNLSAHKYQ